MSTAQSYNTNTYTRIDSGINFFFHSGISLNYSENLKENAILHGDRITSSSLNLKFTNTSKSSSSTWDESDHNEYDIISEFKASKRIKFKTKIKSITKYKPNIIVD